jgi:hypothetical protein
MQEQSLGLMVEIDSGNQGTVMAPEGSDDDGAVLKATVPSTCFTSVEFPGYVRNVDRAIHMLGGEEGLMALSPLHNQSKPFLKVWPTINRELR